MSKVTQVEVVDTDEQLAALFFTRKPLAECQQKKKSREFEGA